MFCARFEASLFGPDIERARAAAAACGGEVSGSEDFDGQVIYAWAEGACFRSAAGRDAFVDMFGQVFLATATDEQLTPGIEPL